jgi:uncharacterized protein YbjQ (UPF0145 family)
MLITTTTSIDKHTITTYHGIVTGEAILGANFLKDLFAGFRDIVGGRSGSYERELRKAREIAMNEMISEAQRFGANAIVGVDIDYETISIQNGGEMLMVTASGTAVTFQAGG